MTIENAIRDYEGSYLLGEADCEHWMLHAHPNEVQSMALLSPDDVGKPDVADQTWAPWLVKKADRYSHRDPRFYRKAYYDGFINAARRERRRRVFTAAEVQAVPAGKRAR
jgi:hypothetical protein